MLQIDWDNMSELERRVCADTSLLMGVKEWTPALRCMALREVTKVAFVNLDLGEITIDDAIYILRCDEYNPSKIMHKSIIDFIGNNVDEITRVFVSIKDDINSWEHRRIVINLYIIGVRDDSVFIKFIMTSMREVLRVVSNQDTIPTETIVECIQRNSCWNNTFELLTEDTVMRVLQYHHDNDDLDIIINNNFITYNLETFQLSLLHDPIEATKAVLSHGYRGTITDETKTMLAVASTYVIGMIKDNKFEEEFGSGALNKLISNLCIIRGEAGVVIKDLVDLVFETYSDLVLHDLRGYEYPLTVERLQVLIDNCSNFEEGICNKNKKHFDIVMPNEIYAMIYRYNPSLLVGVSNDNLTNEEIYNIYHKNGLSEHVFESVLYRGYRHSGVSSNVSYDDVKLLVDLSKYKEGDTSVKSVEDKELFRQHMYNTYANRIYDEATHRLLLSHDVHYATYMDPKFRYLLNDYLDMEEDYEQDEE